MNAIASTHRRLGAVHFEGRAAGVRHDHVLGRTAGAIAGIILVATLSLVVVDATLGYSMTGRPTSAPTMAAPQPRLDPSRVNVPRTTRPEPAPAPDR